MKSESIRILKLLKHPNLSQIKNIMIMQIFSKLTLLLNLISIAIQYSSKKKFILTSKQYYNSKFQVIRINSNTQVTKTIKSRPNENYNYANFHNVKIIIQVDLQFNLIHFKTEFKFLSLQTQIHLDIQTEHYY